MNKDLIKAGQAGAELPPEVLRRREQLEGAAERVLDFANHWVTRQRFERLLLALGVGAALTASGIFAFALGVNRPGVEIKDHPIAVQIFFTRAGEAWAQKQLSCPSQVLAGLAIAGSLDEPEVVTPPTGDCPAQRFIVRRNLAVVVPR